MFMVHLMPHHADSGSLHSCNSWVYVRDGDIPTHRKTLKKMRA